MRLYKKKKFLAGLIVVLVLSSVVFLAWPANGSNQNTENQSETSSPGQAAAAASGFNKKLYPNDQASSLWVVVNKGRALPSSYVPPNLVVPSVPLRLSPASSEMHLRADAAAALEKLFAGAKASGVNLKLESGYRSFSEQQSVYSNYVAASGLAQADTFSARPGHSEHQTGLAADIEPLDRTCEVEQCFENTPEGKWLAANAYKYGFIIRYQKDSQNLTGYEYEPWHVRYLGDQLAAQLHATGQTLEQFFGLPIYTDYPPQSLSLSQ